MSEVSEWARLAGRADALGLPLRDARLCRLNELHFASGVSGPARAFRLAATDDGTLLVAPNEVALSRLSGVARHSKLALTTTTALREAVLEQAPDDVLAAATDGLRRFRPAYSASTTSQRVRKVVAGLAVLGVVAGLAVAFGFAAWAHLGAAATAAALFTTGLMLRLAAFGLAFDTAGPTAEIETHRLPSATVLIALYRETEVIPQLLAALAAVDYPAERIEILLLVEADDPDTAAAIRAHDHAGRVEIVIVPPGQPRTKPRALQVGLLMARGEILAVYDAEDVPHPKQLRAAAAALKARTVACVQAPLHVPTADTPWGRQFALEYDAHFRVLIPALARLGLPVPLGGTSNVFRTEALRRVGGWDPWNVTEDADLGLRLARYGYDIATVPHPTREEAPRTMRDWVNQRRRWMKGYLQTLLVHAGTPRRTVRDLGLVRLAAAVSMLGGTLAAGLLYPVGSLAFVLWFLDPEPRTGVAAVADAMLLTVFAGGLVVPMLVAAAARRDSLGRSCLTILTMPIYWLAVSWATYRACWDVIRAPFHWLKTPHHGQATPAQSRARKATAARSGSVTSNVETKRPLRSRR